VNDEHQAIKTPNIIICQRYQTYHDWKPNKNFQALTLPYNSAAISGENSPPISVAVRTFSGTDAPSGITRYWAQIDSPGTYPFGNGFVVDPEAKWPMQVDYSIGRSGEVDLLVGLFNNDPDNIEAARDLLGYLTYLIAFLAHELFDDMVKPLGEPQISVHSEGAAARNESLKRRPIFKVPHRVLGDSDVGAILSDVGKSVAPQLVSPRVMELALKRYFCSQTESDPVDAFCDLWECLEFLAPKSTSIKGTVESRIGHYLALYSRQNKGKIESELIRPLYRIRKDIVHNADESPEIIENCLHRIAAVARSMIRYHLGLPYKFDEAILPGSTSNQLWISIIAEINPIEES
jgi:hypothetical protein